MAKKRITVYATVAEKQFLEKAAERAGLNLSQYLLACAFNQSPKIAPSKMETKKEQQLDRNLNDQKKEKENEYVQTLFGTWKKEDFKITDQELNEQFNNPNSIFYDPGIADKIERSDYVDFEEIKEDRSMSAKIRNLRKEGKRKYGIMKELGLNENEYYMYL